MSVRQVLSRSFRMRIVPSLIPCKTRPGWSVAGLAAAMLLSLTPLPGMAGSSGSVQAPGGPVALTVHKSPTCGCCGDWMEHMEAAGFATQGNHPENLAALKARYGVSPELQSCHTAVTPEGHVFEGHVPARFVEMFLASPPANARGLAVPAMPVGSPGMEVGERFMPYQVLLLMRDGSTRVFAEVRRAEDQYAPL